MASTPIVPIPSQKENNEMTTLITLALPAILVTMLMEVREGRMASNRASAAGGIAILASAAMLGLAGAL